MNCSRTLHRRFAATSRHKNDIVSYEYLINIWLSLQRKWVPLAESNKNGFFSQTKILDGMCVSVCLLCWNGFLPCTSE